MDKKLPYTKFSDPALVTAYRKTRDQEYLLTLYQRYAGLLFGVCLKYLKAPDLAQDACTDIYEELVKKLMVHEVDNFKPWLHTVAKNHCLQKLRSGKKSQTADLPDDFMQLDDTWHLEEIMTRELHLKTMENCMEQLNANQKKMVELFYLQEKCYNEIVELTGHSWNNVRSYIQNGRRNLKLCMEQHTSA